MLADIFNESVYNLIQITNDIILNVFEPAKYLPSMNTGREDGNIETISLTRSSQPSRGNVALSITYLQKLC